MRVFYMSGIFMQCYQEALSKIKAAAGELHHFLDRLYLNVGIYYEEVIVTS